MEQLPVEELALAEEEKELQQVVRRERCEGQDRASIVEAAVVAPLSDFAARPVDEETRHQQSPMPPWGVEKLWSDSESDDGVEETKLSTPQTIPVAVAPKATGDGEGGEGTGKTSSLGEAAAAVDAVPDLLGDGGYVDVEPANPPALADWIALGATEARDALAAIDERSPEYLQQDDVRRHRGPEAAKAAVGADERRDLDEDSFCSGGIISGEVERDYNDADSDADSEARLTALVERIAVRGENSRAAEIVQALVRGRAARRFAAVERGRMCEQEEARAAAAEQAAVASTSFATADLDGPAGGAGHGAVIEDMAWLARKETREGLSDSFGSSDLGHGEAALLVRLCSLSFFFRISSLCS